MDPSGYAEQRYKDGLECAKRATQFDQDGHYSAALSFYSEAVEALNNACYMSPFFNPILPRVQEYSRRAEEIRQYLSSVREPPRPITPGTSTNKDKQLKNQIEYFLELANRDDERGQRSDAERMYTCAIELALQAQKVMISEVEKASVKAITREALNKLEQLKLTETSSSLDKFLKQMPTPPKDLPNEGRKARTLPPPSSRPYRGPLTSFLDADSDLTTAPKFEAYSSPSPSPSSSRPAGAPAATSSSRPAGLHSTVQGKKHKGAKFTEFELKVLRATSVINGITYLPWSDQDLVELRTVSSLPQEFKDPQGLPRLGEKQKAKLEAWLRPHDIHENPKMVHIISSFTIKQSIIGDCSFIASLAICADYERRFKTRLITRCLYPQNRSGDPIINPNGKYLVCFNLNGCRRKVVIDDRLPVGHHGELLCSYSSNRDEFWISILEKAYMKVMGGYDFPGSSSNIDLHALTGWIPERAGLKRDECDDALFKKMEQSLKRGDVLITVATGVLSEAMAERAGLVKTHAYAVLRVVEINGWKLLHLKNPWSHQRWKGNFSENDQVHWTPELRKALNYDQTQALQVDNGVFWIDWKSLREYYDVVYMNWRPEMFRHKSTIHDVWKPSGVEKDWYNISNNPQYSLRVQCREPSANIWVLISRHITTKSDFANNEKFITLNIARSGGGRIYYPEKFLVSGVKINTPHYLAKLEGVPQGPSSYTIIVSQLESLSTIHYTLKVYSTCEFSLSAVPNPWSHSKKLKGEWRPGQRSPPKFILTTVSVSSKVLVKLQAPKELYVHLEMSPDSQVVDFHKANSGPLRPGFTVLECPEVPKGNFAVTPTTHTALPGKPVPFFITLLSDNVFNFELVE